MDTKEPPPTYHESAYDQPLPPASQPQLNLTFLLGVPPPIYAATYHLAGDSRDSDLILTHPSSPVPLMTIETESTLVYHHSHITDHRPGGVMHILKRQSNLPNNDYRYSIITHGAQGRKVIEITTTDDIATSSAKATRLIFRRSDDGELDALTLRTSFPNSSRTKDPRELDMRVEYQKRPIGKITLTSRPEKPVYELSVDVGGVDPVLFAILAAVVDDRLMISKRRLRRQPLQGATGLATVYARG